MPDTMVAPPDSRAPLSFTNIYEYLNLSVEDRELILQDMMGWDEVDDKAHVHGRGQRLQQQQPQQREQGKGKGGITANANANSYAGPSSSTEGFFQQRPQLENQFSEDQALRRVLTAYLPSHIQRSVSPDLTRFGDLVLTKKVFNWVADAEKNVPYVKTWDAFGKRKDELITSEGWRCLQDLGIREGIVAIPYENREGEFSRVYQFLKYHIWSGSCAFVTCPSAMTDGAAALLKKHLLHPSTSSTSSTPRTVLSSAFKRLTSRDPTHAWTSGQWMTERKGGSDVSGTETLAVTGPSSLTSQRSIDGSPLGPYSISGFKWFSSATDAQMTVLLARTPDGGISAFYAPMRRTLPSTGQTGIESESELNGVSIQRLKSKLGSRALPTAELVLDDMRGYILGAPGSGVKEIATVLNITRVHNSVTALGFWGRGLAIARAWARVRFVNGGKVLLSDVPAHVTTLARLHVEYRGWMHLTFFAVLLLGVTEQEQEQQAVSHHLLPPRRDDAALLLRVLTPVMKALTAKASILGLGECMECLGGVGYLESEDVDLNVTRLVRDASVLSIWEGTTDVMGVDTLRAVKGRGGEDVIGALGRWIDHVSTKVGDHDHRMEILREKWEAWVERIQNSSLEHELLIDVRVLMEELGVIVAGVLVVADAEREGDEVASEVARRWVAGGVGNVTVKDRVMWDRRIVFGNEKASESQVGPWQPPSKL